MFCFIRQKIWNKKWMAASLWIGNLLFIAIAVSSPVYAQAVMQKVAIQMLYAEHTASGDNPGAVTLDISLSSGNGGLSDPVSQAEEFCTSIGPALGLPSLLSSIQYYTPAFSARPLVERNGAKAQTDLRFSYLSGMEEYARIKSGSFPKAPAEDGVIEAVVSVRTLSEQDMLIGDEYLLPKLQQPDGEPYRLRITGVFEPAPDSGDFWDVSPSSYLNRCFLSKETFERLFLSDKITSQTLGIHYYTLLDYSQIKGSRANGYLASLRQLNEQAALMGGSVSNRMEGVLESYLPQERKLSVSLLVLQVPVYILLAAFLFMVSKQMLELEENEIAVLKSRGAAKGQILQIYLLQSGLIALAGLLPGIPLGLFVCQVLGASNAFLEFVQRSSLDVSLSPAAIAAAGAALLLSICAMVLPALRHANVSIVGYKQKKQRKWKAPWWQKCFLDVLLLGISLYGWYSFQSARDLLAAQAADGSALDPLLYFSSSLFILGLGLLGLRLFPFLVRLIFFIGKRLWTPALYVSILRVVRTRSGQGFLMLFLVLTISLGIYNAEAARTINQNAEEQIRYGIGADIVLQEVWKNNAGPVLSDIEASMQAEQETLNPTIKEGVTYYEPDFSRFQEIEGVVQTARVLRDTQTTVQIGSAGTGHSLRSVTLLGIHTKEFVETAWMKEGLFPIHWYHYLNAMSQNAHAVLLSSNFEREYGLKLGESISYANSQGQRIQGMICGFVDYWPSYAPVVRETGDDGLTQEREQYLIVANLSQVQSVWGITPYEVWMKLEGSSQPVYDFIEENGLSLRSFRDAQSEWIACKNDPLFQGTNGNLTVGFIVVLLLCFVGFLIYWILSIQTRVLQFGIFRAMGMSMREVIGMLFTEQLFLSGSAIGLGVVVGLLVSRLFVPLIQIGYTAADQTLPLEVVGASSDFIRLFTVIAGMVVLCMAVLGIRISRIRISQALKLGED